MSIMQTMNAMDKLEIHVNHTRVFFHPGRLSGEANMSTIPYYCKLYIVFCIPLNLIRKTNILCMLLT